jgi:hypothetical protein
MGCLGVPLAIMLSIKSWGLTWWVVLHAAFGWFYVLYWIVFLSGWVR